MATSNPIVAANNIELSHSSEDYTNEPAPSFKDLVDGDPERNSTEARSVSLESTLNNASIMSCYVNLANTILGSGMLGLPYAFASAGWGLGSILLIFSCLSSAFSLHTLSLCAMSLPGPSSFYSVGHHVMPAFTLVIDFAVAIKCFGVATSYLIVIGDLMPDVMEQFDAPEFWHSRFIWVIFGFMIVAPLSCLRNLDSLKFTSFVSIVFVAFLTILIILYSFEVGDLDACQDIDDDEVCVGEKSNFKTDMNTLRVLSIFIFGFTCQQNIFAVVNELKQRTPSRVNSVIGLAIGTALLLYITVAGFGYETYGDEVESDILVNYPETYLTSTARLFVSLLVAFSYPLQAHPARRCILTLVGTLEKEGTELTPHAQVVRYAIDTVSGTPFHFIHTPFFPLS